MNHQSNYFLQTIEHLRHYEEVMLYGNLLAVNENHQQEVIAYLEKQYKEEATHYPSFAPGFDTEAALWGAKTVYVAAQLLLYRETQPSELDSLLPVYEHEINASAILSADLTLRFLPDVIKHLQAIDPDDKLISILEKHLTTWHYSGINYELLPNELDFSPVLANQSLLQLYVDKVIEYKKIALANHPALKDAVKASLGMFAAVYWNDFAQTIAIENDNH